MSAPPSVDGAARLLEQARLCEATDDPHRLARVYVQSLRDAGGAVLYHREEFLRYHRGAYRRVLDAEVRAGLCRCVKGEFDRVARLRRALAEAQGEAEDGKPSKVPPPQRVTSRLIGDVKQALASETLLEGTVEPPCWLDGRASPDPSRLLVCRNGIVSLDDWAAGRPCLSPPTPELFAAAALPFDFDPDAPDPPRWGEFLESLWPDDAESVGMLQEWFGYCLTPDTSQHKILLVVGPRRSGKGTVGRVLTQLVGGMNVCNPTLSSLGGEFGLQPLLGKTLALISDARLSGRADGVMVTERLLSISGEDGQTVNRKHLSQVTLPLPLRFAILTNELPRLTDSSAALAGRMLLLRLTRSWYGNEDRALTDRLLRELPGILLWALRGWQRLNGRGHFLTPASSAELHQDLDDLVSPIGVFVRECCRVAAGARVAIADLYRRYRQWCETSGREPSSEQIFGRDLRAAVPCLGKSQPRINGRQTWHYTGLRLCDDHDDAEGEVEAADTADTGDTSV